MILKLLCVVFGILLGFAALYLTGWVMFINGFSGGGVSDYALFVPLLIPVFAFVGFTIFARYMQVPLLHFSFILFPYALSLCGLWYPFTH